MGLPLFLKRTEVQACLSATSSNEKRFHNKNAHRGEGPLSQGKGEGAKETGPGSKLARAARIGESGQLAASERTSGRLFAFGADTSYSFSTPRCSLPPTSAAPPLAGFTLTSRRLPR